MPQTVGNAEVVEQPSSCGSTAVAAAEDSQATVPLEPSSAKRQKTEKTEDSRVGTASVELSENELTTLLELDKTYPHWPSRRSTNPRVLHPLRKRIAVESEMRAIFPHLPANITKKTLRNICVRTAKQRELVELRRFKMHCTDGAEKDNKTVVLDLEQKAKLAKEAAEKQAAELMTKLAASEERAAGLKSALLERSGRCSKLEEMVRKADVANARLKRQLRMEIKLRMEQLQDTDEVAEEAAGGEAAG